jgi:hypothetical protein
MLFNLLDLVDGQTPGQTSIVGAMHNTEGMVIHVPDDIGDRPPPIWIWAQAMAESIVKVTGARAIIYGTQLTQIPPRLGITKGILYAWYRRNRTDYLVQQVELTHNLKLNTVLEHATTDHSLIIFVVDEEDDDLAKDNRIPEMDDISMIEHIDPTGNDTTMNAPPF